MAELDPADFGLAPASPAAPAPAAPAPGAATPSLDFSLTAPRRTAPAPAEIPTMTVTAKPKPVPAPAPKAASSFDPAEFGLVPATPAAPPAAAPAAEPKSTWADIPGVITGGVASMINAIPQGLAGSKGAEYINAATAALPRMLYGDKPGTQRQGLYGPEPDTGFRFLDPVSAFQEALAHERQVNQTLNTANPAWSTAGRFAGAGLGAALASPALGWNTAAGVLPRLGAAASYAGRNAAFGAGMSALDGGDPLTGAAIGSLFPLAHMTGSSIYQPIAAAGRRFGPLFTEGAQQTSVGRVLNRIPGNLTPDTSPVGPLDLGQATNNPEIAARVDAARGFNATANANLRQAQQDALTAQVGRIGRPATMPDAGARLTESLRNAAQIANEHERALWQVPELSQTQVQTNWVRNSVRQAADGLEPGLRLGVTGPIRSALDALDNMPARATVRDLNSIRTALRLAGRPSESNPWARVVSNHLQTAFLDAMDRTLGASTVSPNVANAYRAARDFTRNLRTGPLSTPAMERALDEDVPASEASRRLFNFSFGSPEGPTSIADVSRYVAGLRNNTSGVVSASIRDSARSYIAAAMRHAGRLDEGQIANPKLLQDFVRTNGPWMVSSGILERPQLQALHDLVDYTAMLRRPEQLLRQVNSATAERLRRGDTFIDAIMAPWMQRIATIGGMLTGGHAAGVAGEVGGMVIGHQAAGMVERAEQAMRDMMAEAVHDPRIAQDFMMRASRANQAFLSPQAKRVLEAARVAGTNIIPGQLLAPSDRPTAPALPQQ